MVDVSLMNQPGPSPVVPIELASAPMPILVLEVQLSVMSSPCPRSSVLGQSAPGQQVVGAESEVYPVRYPDEAEKALAQSDLG